jgi:hypothetical protein
MKKILLVDAVIAFHDRNKSLLNRSEFRILTAITGPLEACPGSPDPFSRGIFMPE